MNKLLTISIAAYNVEKYIKQALDSILGDSNIPADLKSKIEVLVINDGSTDHTAMYAMRYEEQFPGIVKVINKENGGHGSTINIGIQEASGSYFKVLDGDDWLDGAALAYVIKHLEKAEADMVITDYMKCYKNKKCLIESTENSNIVEKKKYIFDEIINKISWLAFHSAIFKTSILKDNRIKVDENCFYVDTELMIYLIPYIQTLEYLKCNLYCYRLGVDGQSVSRKGRKKNMSDEKRVTYSLFSKYQETKQILSLPKRKYMIRGIAGHCVWHYKTLLLFKPEKKIKNQIIDFDKKIKSVSNEVYSNMEHQSALVHLMRKSHYLLYMPLCLYRRHKREK